MSKLIYIVCGPDGAGKSTFIKTQLYSRDLEILNPDQLFRRHQKEKAGTDPTEIWRNVNNYVKNRFEEIIGKGENLVLETSFANENMLEQMKDAKTKGYEIEVHYLSLENSAMHYDRVTFRSQFDGYQIRKEQIEKRIYQDYEKLSEILIIADRGFIYNNSGQFPFKVMEVLDGRIQYVIQDQRRIPDPVKIGLKDTLLKKGELIINQTLEKAKKGQIVYAASISIKGEPEQYKFPITISKDEISTMNETELKSILNGKTAEFIEKHPVLSKRIDETFSVSVKPAHDPEKNLGPGKGRGI